MTMARVPDSDPAQHGGNMMYRCSHHRTHLLRVHRSNCVTEPSCCNVWPREVRRKNPNSELMDVASQRSHAVKSDTRSIRTAGAPSKAVCSQAG